MRPAPLLTGSLLLAALGSSPAHADADGPTRVIGGIGVAVPLVSHTLYDVGVLVQGGADLPLGTSGTHRLRVVGGWIGLATTGARVDLGLVQAAWRIAPSWGRGVHLDVGSGLVFEVERFRLDLPGPSVMVASTRVGMPASIAVGIGLGRWVELEVGYQQLVFFNALHRTAGIAHATIGGRL